MGIDKRIVDSAGNEALVDATDKALQVKATLASTADLDTIETTLDAIQTLLGGTAKVKIWDGTHTLDIAADSTMPVSGTVAIQEPLSVDDNAGSLTVDQATPANLKNQIHGLEGANVRAVKVNASGELVIALS